MAGDDVELYFDLGSPYAHLAVARAERVIGRPPVLRAAEAGLPGNELEAAVASPAVKARLRELTEQAWERGVRGIPTIAVGKTLIYGDDQLEQVPQLLAG